MLTRPVLILFLSSFTSFIYGQAWVPGTFDIKTRVEEKSDSGNYLLKNDGSKVYGKKISWSYTIVSGGTIKIDDQKFSSADIKGYRDGSSYFTRFEKMYLRRIVRGKVNVYIRFPPGNSAYNAQGRYTPSQEQSNMAYVQVGDDGELERLKDLDDILKVLSSCNKAVAMLDIGKKELRNAIKDDGHYLNEAFEVYNNDCKAVGVGKASYKKDY